MFNLPEDFNPESYDAVPYGSQTIFEGAQSELEALAKTAIRASLTKRLGKPVVGRDDSSTRFGMKKLGLSQNDLLTGKVLLR
jgi:hypothetical protein